MRVRVSQKESDFKKASNEYKKASRHEKNKYFSTLKNVWSHPNISSKKIWDFTKLIIAPVGLARHLLSF